MKKNNNRQTKLCDFLGPQANNNNNNRITIKKYKQKQNKQKTGCSTGDI